MYAPLRPAARVVIRAGSFAIPLLALAALAACSDSTAVRTSGGSQLAFTTRSTTGATTSSLADAIPITKNGHTLDLTQVTIVVARAQLKRQNNDACTGDENEHDAKWAGRAESCASVKIGPTLVDLPLDTGMVSLPMDLIPAGTYREIEFRVSLARLVGTFDGHAFDVTIPVEASSEIAFATPLVVGDSTPTSITINVPISSWLANPDGSLVDPRQILTSPTLLAAIKSRVSASFRAFQDQDHNGKEDHGSGDR